MFVPHRQHTYGPNGLLLESFHFFICRYDVRTSEETYTGLHELYKDSFTFLYVDDVGVSQDRRHGLPRPVTGIALHCYM
jgi:hypothetical protein